MHDKMCVTVVTLLVHLMAFDFAKLKSLLGLDLKGSKDAPIIGVDMGASAIKLVQLHSEEGVPTLDTYGELQLGPYGESDVGNTVSLENKRLMEAFVDIIRESSITGSNAALSISYATSFATTLIVDAVDEEAIAKLVPIEARKYIPVQLSEVTLDWFTLGVNEETKQTKLFLVAIHNDGFAQSKTILSGVGLSLAYAELEPFSATRAALSEARTSAAIVDLGASATKLYIVENGTMQKTHSVTTGGVALTSALAGALGVSFKDAEGQKRTHGLRAAEESATVSKTLQKELDRVTHELSRVIGDYEKEKGAQLSSIVLTGGGAEMVGMLEYMQDTLQRKTFLGAPFNKVAYPAFLEDSLKAAGPSFTVAIGAALRQFSE